MQALHINRAFKKGGSKPPTLLVSGHSFGSTVSAQRRSIVGAGGVGKTTTAISVARSLFGTFADDICFVDLGLLGDPQSVAFAVASSTNVSTKSSDLLEALLSALSRKHTLIVLDGCEHVAEAVTGLAEAILRSCPDVHLLATSREALRAEGECVYRLQPLECPPDVPGMTAAEILKYPAARLFVDRLSTRGVAPDRRHFRRD